VWKYSNGKSIHLNCETSSKRHIIDELRTIPGIKGAHRIMGAYNVITEMESSSLEELQKIIVFKIRKMDMIKSTLTLVGIDEQGYSTY
jgi:DNA-binding Lrp family transcriptional regulator